MEVFATEVHLSHDVKQNSFYALPFPQSEVLFTQCSTHEIAELKHYLSPFLLVLPGIFFFLGRNSDFFWFMPAHTVSDTKMQSSPAFSITPGAPQLR